MLTAISHDRRLEPRGKPPRGTIVYRWHVRFLGLHRVFQSGYIVKVLREGLMSPDAHGIQSVSSWNWSVNGAGSHYDR